jgi:flagellum-specific ATP synthase
MDEPIADAVRGILDGHIVLSRRLAQRNHYPAIDVLSSISRLAPMVSGPVTRKVAGYVRKMMSTYAEAEDLIDVGAYRAGTNPAIDEAVAKRGAIEDFLIQAIEERSGIQDTLTTLGTVAGMEIPNAEFEAFQSAKAPAVSLNQGGPLLAGLRAASAGATEGSPG